MTWFLVSTKTIGDLLSPDSLKPALEGITSVVIKKPSKKLLHHMVPVSCISYGNLCRFHALGVSVPTHIWSELTVLQTSMLLKLQQNKVNIHRFDAL